MSPQRHKVHKVLFLFSFVSLVSLWSIASSEALWFRFSVLGSGLWPNGDEWGEVVEERRADSFDVSQIVN
jgi:hypothetical protein